MNSEEKLMPSERERVREEKKSEFRINKVLNRIQVAKQPSL